MMRAEQRLPIGTVPEQPRSLPITWHRLARATGANTTLLVLFMTGIQSPIQPDMPQLRLKATEPNIRIHDPARRPLGPLIDPQRHQVPCPQHIDRRPQREGAREGCEEPEPPTARGDQACRGPRDGDPGAGPEQRAHLHEPAPEEHPDVPAG